MNALILAGIVTLAGIGADSPSPLDDGFRALRERDHGGAAINFSAATLSDRSGWAAYLEAYSLAEGGRIADALSALEAPILREATPAGFAAAMLHADIEGTHRPYEASGRLLAFSSDLRFGGEALFEAGRILGASSDTTNAVKMWVDAVLLHPESPWAHASVLALTALPPARLDAILRSDDFLALKIARAAYRADDFTTALIVTENVANRAVDRRLREEFLLIAGKSYFRLSEYENAAKNFSEAERNSATTSGKRDAARWQTLAKLQRGDTSELARNISRLELKTAEPELRERFRAMASRLIHQSDRVSARLLLDQLGVAVLEEFIAAINFAEDQSQNSGGREASIRIASAIAERLTEPTDRSLAKSILAEISSGGDEAWIWREIIKEAEDEAIAAWAEKRISLIPTDPKIAERDAAAILRAGRDAEAAGNFPIALRQYRLTKLGYPGTRSAAAAAELLRALVTARFSRERDASARLIEDLLGAGLAREAEYLARASTTPASAAALAIGYARMGATSRSLFELDRLVGELGNAPRIFRDELPSELAEIFYPLPDRKLFTAPQSKSQSKVAPEILAALVRLESRFDEGYHDAFLVGYSALPTEMISFAPKLSRLDPTTAMAALFDKSTAIEVLGWYVDALAEITGETLPYRLAAAKRAGPANIPATRAMRGEFRWIAALPFPETRKFILRYLVATENYRKEFAIGR